MIKDNIIFLKQCVTDFQTTGALCRSSRKAANALTVPLRTDRLPLRILELGPGTGSVTVKILEDMLPGDELDICEINPSFMDALKKKLRKNEKFLLHQDQVNFRLCPAQDLTEDKKFDVIICCLPFLNFNIETVRAIFDKLEALSTPDTVMTYFEYAGIRSVGKFVSPRLREINDFMVNLYDERRVREMKVWFNLFPMNVHMLKLAA